MDSIVNIFVYDSTGTADLDLSKLPTNLAHHVDKHRTTLAKTNSYCAYRILSQFYDTIDFLPNGKPTVFEGNVAISHSGSIVAVAFAEQPLAIDVQIIDQRIDRLPIDKWLSQREKRRLTWHINKQKYKTKLWTSKECIAKYDGNGIKDFFKNIIDTTTTSFNFWHRTVTNTNQYILTVATKGKTTVMFYQLDSLPE